MSWLKRFFPCSRYRPLIGMCCLQVIMTFFTIIFKLILSVLFDFFVRRSHPIGIYDSIKLQIKLENCNLMLLVVILYSLLLSGRITNNLDKPIKNVTDLVFSLIAEIYLQESAIVWRCQKYLAHCDLNWKW